MNDRTLNNFGGEPLASDWAPPEIDSTKAHPARIYDVMIGGKDHFPVDRAAAENARKYLPQLWDMAKANRAFLGRAVRFLASSGIDQFLDIGTGIPGPGNTGQAARAIAPEARVVYVDYDPIVAVHSRALLAGADPALTGVVLADVRDPDSILQHPGVRAVLDFERPIAVLMVALLHFVSDAEDPAGIVRRFMDAVVPGSALVLSHATLGDDPVANIEGPKGWDQATSKLYLRPLEQIVPLFECVDVVEPGIVQPQLWRPDPQEDNTVEALFPCGVGYKK